MEKLVIEGGVPLSGTIVAAGNKNAALPLLAASLLTEERVEIANVPRIRDTEAMLALLADLGVSVEWLGDNDVRLRAVEDDRSEAAQLGRPCGGSRWTPFLLAMTLVAVYHQGRVKRGHTTMT